ncbi:type VI secretion system protein TssA [Rugamonas sp.]|uniref:type VI secretion system protein TssA n=1 Tax=Rugamonas sp. TaxID=1926287 RepID=UPI0025EFE7BA|nr:type VI secretion system protein TssA [Rugamonas sp.]
MSGADLDAFFLDLEADAPCGGNLEYDPDFVALEQDMLGKPEVQYGDTITAAVPPEWKAVKRVALQLLARSRDLRLAVHLLRANLALQGLPGLTDGLRLIERLLEERWDSVHPELDADDDMDPTLRINSLAVLADRTTVLKDLRDVTLLTLPGLGPLRLRMLDIASGELAPSEGQDKVAMESIERALRDVDVVALAAARDALARAYDSAVNIETVLVRQVGHAHALNLDGLTRMLKRGRDALGVEAAASEADEADDADGAGAAGGASADAPARRGAAISGEIASRDDVVRMLNKIIGYYEQHEPSSPLPLLLMRARRLVPKSFMEILEDLAPDGVQQASFLRGPQDE